MFRPQFWYCFWYYQHSCLYCQYHLLAGRIWDTQHTYKPFWLGGAIFGVIALIVVLTMAPAAKQVKNYISGVKPDRGPELAK